MDDAKKEQIEVSNMLKLQDEIDSSKQKDQGLKQENDKVMLETYSASDALQKKTRIREEIEKNVTITKREIEIEKGSSDKGSGQNTKLVGDKYNQYASLIESNLYEFGKIRSLIEKKEKERIEALTDNYSSAGGAFQGGRSGQVQVSSAIDYGKPQKPVISVVYVKVVFA